MDNAKRFSLRLSILLCWSNHLDVIGRFSKCAFLVALDYDPARAIHGDCVPTNVPMQGSYKWLERYLGGCPALESVHFWMVCMLQR